MPLDAEAREPLACQQVVTGTYLHWLQRAAKIVRNAMTKVKKVH